MYINIQHDFCIGLKQGDNLNKILDDIERVSNLLIFTDNMHRILTFTFSKVPTIDN